MILPEATAIGLRLNHASREGSALGRPLSNTRITCPWVEDKLGKLSIILHRPSMLECLMVKSYGAQGWVCGLSGRSWCNGPTSLRRVRALREVARRWTLRHESRPYGAQQVRKLRNVGNHDEGNPSACTMCRLFPCLKSMESKGWVRRVPAAAVIPAARVVVVIIGPKTSVAGPVNSWGNRSAQLTEVRGDCRAWDWVRSEVLQG